MKQDIAMTAPLPQPLAAYFAATNKHDIDAMLAPFDEDASVKDEGQTHYGQLAIRSWMEDTTRKYRFTVEVRDVRDEKGKTVVSGLVSGDFPGSPALLRHAFMLSGQKITRLEIT
jgi:ketosteroid isomerase-like protein